MRSDPARPVVESWLKSSLIPANLRARVLRRFRRIPLSFDAGLLPELATARPMRSWTRRIESLLLRSAANDGAEVRRELRRILGPRRFAAWVRLLAAAAYLADPGCAFRELLENAADGLLVADGRGKIVYVNETAARMLGHRRDELVGQNLRDTYAPEEAHRLKQRLRALRRHGTLSIERQMRRKDGTFLPVDIRVRQVREGYLLGIIRDLSERRSRDTRFRRVFESNLIGIAITRPDGILSAANDAYLKMCGGSASEVRAERQRWAGPIDELRRLVGMPPRQLELLRADGTRFPAVVGVAGIENDRILAFLLDLSEQKRLESDLQHAHQLEAVGRLASGIAHDFNNLLLVIRGYADLAAQKTDLRYLEKIRGATDRAQSLVRKLLAFGRKQTLSARVLNLNDVVSEMGSVLRRVIGENIEIRSCLDPALAPVRVDPSQMEQVILNLAVNARDAMPQGGTLTIETANTQVQGAPAVELTIRDTGRGMDDSVQRRLFEPYFTTKPRGAGTGLGLALVYGIVKQSGGSISCSSTPGLGSTFRITFPATAAVEPATATPQAPKAPRGGTETLLVVEDDEEVRSVTTRLLRERGYRVLEAPTGEDALAVARKEAVDLVITDVILPGIPGTEIARELEHVRPGTKVLYFTGYPDRFAGDSPAFLDKSLPPRDIVERVRDTIDGV